MKTKSRILAAVLALLMAISGISAYADNNAAASQPMPFTDVALDSWYAPYVRTVWLNSLFQGTAADTFAPRDTMTRAMFVQVLANLDSADLAGYAATAPLFDDTNSTAWYFAAVQWAATHDIVRGVAPQQFAPSRAVTREEMAVMLHNYIISRGVEFDTTQIDAPPFADQNDISAWAAHAVNSIRNIGIILGHPDGTFAPRDTATRAEVAAIFARYLQLLSIAGDADANGADDEAAADADRRPITQIVTPGQDYDDYPDYNDGGNVYTPIIVPTPTFVAVSSITKTSALTVVAGTPLTLTATVAPSNATNTAITWSIAAAGTTNANISGNTLNTTAGGIVTVRATIVNGATATTNFTQDFDISVTPATPTGTGTALDPYILLTPQCLHWMNAYDPWDGVHFRLGANIVADSNFMVGRLGTEPPRQFTGIFDGDGYYIRVNINQPSLNNVGLFAAIGPAGEVLNVEVRGNIIGGSQVGGIAGGNGGLIYGGYVNFFDGSIHGVNIVGGVVGSNSGQIQNSYTVVNVSGTGSNIGGVVGAMSGTANNVFALGTVSGNSIIGGLVGSSSASAGISNSVALNVHGMTVAVGNELSAGRVSGPSVGILQSNNLGWSPPGGDYMLLNGVNVPVSPTLLNQGATIHGRPPQATWVGLGFDFTSSGAWDWNTATGLPMLHNIRSAQNHHLTIPSGDGTAASPYILLTAEHLHWMNAYNPWAGVYFRLGANIVADDEFMIGRVGTELVPRMFTGIFDGDGFYVQVNINRPTLADVGLFSAICTSGVVENLEVRGSITGGDSVGGIAGFNNGLIRGSYVNAVSIHGVNEVGGAVGVNNGQIQNSYTAVNVSGTGLNIGGVVGVTTLGGTVNNVFALGSVSGNEFVGGLAGHLDTGATISNSVALNVHGLAVAVGNEWLAGRVVGGIPAGTLTNNRGWSPISGDYMLLNDENEPVVSNPNGPHGETIHGRPILTEWENLFFNFGSSGAWDWNNDTDLPMLRNINSPQNH